MKKQFAKKIYFAAEIILIILIAALIPLNLYVCNFPQWVVIIMGLITMTTAIFYSVKFCVKKLSKIINIVLTTFFSAFFIIAAYAVPYWNSYSFKQFKGHRLGYDEIITFEQAENDMNDFMRLLKQKHPMFKSGLTTEIKNRREQSMERLGNLSEITVNDFRRELQYIINPMHDAHTTTYNNFPNDRYLKTAPQRTYENYELISFNGMTIDKAKETAKPYYSYETESWISVNCGSLASLDFYNFSAPYVYEWDNGSGEILREECSESDFVPYDEYIKISNEFADDDSLEKPFVYYEINEDKSLAVLTLSRCIYNEQYKNCVKEMFTEVKEKNIKNVAVDLRNNGGGNSLVADEFVKYLPIDKFVSLSNDWRFNFITVHFDSEVKNKRCSELTFTGDVYVITNKGSFSSAMIFPLIIQDNKLGKIIGESPANSANSYGDVATFYLKETGLPVQISTKKFSRDSSENDYIVPDFPCDGEDALETLYSVIS